MGRPRRRRRRGRRATQRRHPPAGLPAAAGVGRRPLPQGRVDAPDRQPQAPAGALAVPLRALLGADHRGQHGRGGIQRLDRGQRGLLRADARPAVRGGDAGDHEPREGRAHRVPRRPLPLRGPAHGDLRGGPAPGRRVRGPLPRPVHQRRAGHRLAGQQQHRRVGLHPAGAGAPSRARVGRGRCRHGRHQRDHRPLRPLPAAADASRGGRPRGVVVLPGLARRATRRC